MRENEAAVKLNGLGIVCKGLVEFLSDEVHFIESINDYVNKFAQPTLATVIVDIGIVCIMSDRRLEVTKGRRRVAYHTIRQNKLNWTKTKIVRDVPNSIWTLAILTQL